MIPRSSRWLAFERSIDIRKCEQNIKRNRWPIDVLWTTPANIIYMISSAVHKQKQKNTILTKFCNEAQRARTNDGQIDHGLFSYTFSIVLKMMYGNLFCSLNHLYIAWHMQIYIKSTQRKSSFIAHWNPIAIVGNYRWIPNQLKAGRVVSFWRSKFNSKITSHI